MWWIPVVIILYMLIGAFFGLSAIVNLTGETNTPDIFEKSFKENNRKDFFWCMYAMILAAVITLFTWPIGLLIGYSKELFNKIFKKENEENV